MPGGGASNGAHTRLLPATIVLLYLICATLWSLTVPPFESPDEPGHARYVNFVRANGRLPLPATEAPGESHQPPLYYLVAAGISRLTGLEPIAVEPTRNPGFRWYGGVQENKYLHPATEAPPLSGTAASLHWMRLLSVVLGAGTVLLVYVMAASGGAGPHSAALTAALVAFLPQFTFISAGLNNDNLANTLSAGSLACLTWAARDPRRPAAWAAAGCLAGLGVAAKFTCLILLPAGLIAAALLLRGGPRSRAALTFLGPAMAIPMPVWARNFWLVGDPFGAGAQAETLHNLLDQKNLFSTYFLVEFPTVLFRSFWGTFGWMSLRMPAWWYAACLAVALAAAAGLMLMRRDAATRRLHLLLGTAVVIQIGQVVAYNMTFTQAQGRFLFPVIGPIAMLMAAGLAEWGRRLGAPPPGPRATYLIVAALAALNLCVLRLVVEPAYLPG